MLCCDVLCPPPPIILPRLTDNGDPSPVPWTPLILVQMLYLPLLVAAVFGGGQHPGSPILAGSGLPPPIPHPAQVPPKPGHMQNHLAALATQLPLHRCGAVFCSVSSSRVAQPDSGHACEAHWFQMEWMRHSCEAHETRLSMASLWMERLKLHIRVLNPRALAPLQLVLNMSPVELSLYQLINITSGAYFLINVAKHSCFLAILRVGVSYLQAWTANCNMTIPTLARATTGVGY